MPRGAAGRPRGRAKPGRLLAADRAREVDRRLRLHASGGPVDRRPARLRTLDARLHRARLPRGCRQLLDRCSRRHVVLSMTTRSRRTRLLLVGVRAPRARRSQAAPRKRLRGLGCPDVGAFRRAGCGDRWRPRCVLGKGRSASARQKRASALEGVRLHQPEVNERPGRPRAVQQSDHLIRVKAPCRSRRGGRCGTAEDDRPVMADGRTSAGQADPVRTGVSRR
jgi:hypothetical protein